MARHEAWQNHFFAAAAGRLIIDGIGAEIRHPEFSSFSLNTFLRRRCWVKARIDNPLSAHGEIDRRFAEDKPALARYNLEGSVSW